MTNKECIIGDCIACNKYYLGCCCAGFTERDITMKEKKGVSHTTAESPRQQMSFEKALEEFCDHYCRKPEETQDQDELDEVCDNCPMVRFFEENHDKVLKLED